MPPGYYSRRQQQFMQTHVVSAVNRQVSSSESALEQQQHVAGQQSRKSSRRPPQARHSSLSVLSLGESLLLRPASGDRLSSGNNSRREEEGGGDGGGEKGGGGRTVSTDEAAAAVAKQPQEQEAQQEQQQEQRKLPKRKRIVIMKKNSVEPKKFLGFRAQRGGSGGGCTMSHKGGSSTAVQRSPRGASVQRTAVFTDEGGSEDGEKRSSCSDRATAKLTDKGSRGAEAAGTEEEGEEKEKGGGEGEQRASASLTEKHDEELWSPAAASGRTTTAKQQPLPLPGSVDAEREPHFTAKEGEKTPTAKRGVEESAADAGDGTGAAHLRLFWSKLLVNQGSDDPQVGGRTAEASADAAKQRNAKRLDPWRRRKGDAARKKEVKEDGATEKERASRPRRTLYNIYRYVKP